MYLPENKSEEEEYRRAQRLYIDRLRIEQAREHGTDLYARAGTEWVGAEVVYVAEGCGLCSPGIARGLYPQFFTEGVGSVDKDGLTDYRLLRSLCEEIHPGVFLDKTRGLTLFAHSYLRRSLSRLNSLNTELLTDLAELADGNAELTVRLRLDPDIVGHPDVKKLIELEFWRGPKFSDDIGLIPSGVAEHKASDRTRLYEEIDRTHFWWKAEEDGFRRTFEVEEIKDAPSLGVSDDYYGCRYVHSEYNLSKTAITHFDGAIRGYSTEQFLKRIEKSIDHSGKHADYTKLFRVDGELKVGQWKAAVVDYFRGNYLIPEYFGTPVAEELELGIVSGGGRPLGPASQVMIGYMDRLGLDVREGGALKSFECMAGFGKKIAACDALTPAFKAAFSMIEGYNDFIFLPYNDRLLNLPTVVLGTGSTLVDQLKSWVAVCQRALNADRAMLDCVSASVAWPSDRYWVVVSMCGEPEVLDGELTKLTEFVRPGLPPSDWVIGLKNGTRSGTAEPNSSTAIAGVKWPGLLRLRHAAKSVEFYVPATHPMFEELREIATTGRAPMA